MFGLQPPDPQTFVLAVIVPSEVAVLVSCLPGISRLDARPHGRNPLRVVSRTDNCLRDGFWTLTLRTLESKHRGLFDGSMLLCSKQFVVDEFCIIRESGTVVGVLPISGILLRLNSEPNLLDGGSVSKHLLYLVA